MNLLTLVYATIAIAVSAPLKPYSPSRTSLLSMRSSIAT